MRGSRFLLLLTGLVLAFTFGLVHLFNLRFQAGDVYPPYSSLRADPLGTKAFYESLANLPDFRVHRHYQSLQKLDNNKAETIFLFGLSAQETRMSDTEELNLLKPMLNTGDRLVVTILPILEMPRSSKKTPTKEKTAKSTGAKTNDTNCVTCATNSVELDKRWGFAYAYSEKATNDLWHTLLYFDKLAPEWNVLETRGKFPAVIERRFGKGSVVLCADSYFVSNEAMRQDRRPKLLADIVGANREIVFDETHLGVRENSGVMILARKYRLHGLLAGLLLLAGLFVWKNAIPFVPSHEDAGSDGIARADGKDSAAGFVNLVRRSIPASELLPTCVAEWKKSLGHTLPVSGNKQHRIEAVVDAQKALPPRQRDPLGAYRRIAEILKERKPS